MKKYTLALIITAAVALELIGLVQYFMASNGAKAELLEKAERDMAESTRVAAVKAEVESAVRNVIGSMQQVIDQPDHQQYAIASRLVKNNPHIVGAGVAFRPGYYKEQGMGQLYAPYAYDDQPDLRVKRKSNGRIHIQTHLLGFDYTNREWFQRPINEGVSLWTQPYVDEGGTHILMCTYVMPVRDRSGRTVGVFFADVPLEDVSLLSMNIYSGISRNSIIIMIIQIISLLALGFIIWRSVQASKRYKEQFVDPEKDHLIKEVERLRDLNHRLVSRNMDLSKRLQEANK